MTSHELERFLICTSLTHILPLHAQLLCITYILVQLIGALVYSTNKLFSGHFHPILKNRAEDLFQRAKSLSPSNTNLLQQQPIFLKDMKKDEHTSPGVADALRNNLGTSWDSRSFSSDSTLKGSVVPLGSGATGFPRGQGGGGRLAWRRASG